MKTETITGIIILIIIFAFLGGILAAAINNYNENFNNCNYDAKILGLKGRYKNNICQLKTENGIWLNEQEYLMLYATSKCPQ